VARALRRRLCIDPFAPDLQCTRIPILPSKAWVMVYDTDSPLALVLLFLQWFGFRYRLKPISPLQASVPKTELATHTKRIP